ncbi:MAG TPA: DUF2723 domain-containing protein [Candidatus Limnocylindria bacterium]|jgi:tetratricopeptide (TPR) repeat protein|nr:DUF2723 domain-containing protein [Candidatus Limnocylindria bacterium]
MSKAKSLPGKPPAPAPKAAESATETVPPAIPAPPRLFRRVDWLTFAITTLIVLIGYLYTIAPDLTLEDSGELAVGSMYAGVPHPPGYPVWTLYTWLFTKLIPFSNIAFRVAVSSAVAAAFSAGLVGLLISRGSSMILESIDLFKSLERRWENPLCLVSGLVGGLLIGFNGYIWSQAVIVEVYTLAVLTFMATLTCLFRWMYAPHQRRFLYLALFFFGLCFCNHQTLIVAAVGLEVAIIAASPKMGRDFFFCNAALYAYVISGRAFGFSGILLDNPGVFFIFNLIGIGSLAVAYAFSGELSNQARLWLTAVVAGLLLLLYFNYHFAANSATTLSAQAGQLVAQGKSAETLIRDLQGYESAAAMGLKLLAIVVLVAIAGLFGLSYGTEKQKRLLAHWWPALACGGCFALGALFYFYMPLASMSNPPMNWGYPRTWKGFIHAFTRGQYEKTNPSIDIITLGRQIAMYAQGCKEEFNWANLLVGLLPFAFLGRMKRRERGWIIGLTGIYVCLAFLLLVLLNPQVDRQSRELVKVFFTSSHVIIALAVGYGISLIGALILTRFDEVRWPLFIGGFAAFAFNLYELASVWQESHFTILRVAAAISVLVSVGFLIFVFLRQVKPVFAPFLAVFLLIPADGILSHWGDNEQRHHYFGFWFGHDMFEPGVDTSAAPAPKDKDGKPLYPPMARDAVLYGGTDPGRFCPTYMIFCESFIPAKDRRDPNFDRRDVVLITQNALADDTYLDYIRAHYNRSAQVDPPFFYDMLNDPNSAARGRTNLLARMAAPLDRYFTKLGASIEKERRAGSSFFEVSSFTDANGLKARLHGQPSTAKMPDLNPGKLATPPDSTALSAYLRQQLGSAADGDAKALADGLNKLIDGPSLYDDPKRFQGIHLSERTLKFAAQNPNTANRIRLNRLLLEEAYPDLIAPSKGGLYPDREIQTATLEDLGRSFSEYSADAARRYSQGTLEPGEVVTPLQDGRVSVSGQIAVMAINGLLTKVMFDKNPDHEFYIEESFPLKWMYPHLVPYGIIMKIERQPVADLSAEQIRRDHEFWSQYSSRLIGNWITYETPIRDICAFALRTYQRRELQGFTGDPKFVRDDNAQKSFSKLRNAQGKSVYAWRAQVAANPVQQQIYLKEAEFALKQAFAFCPYSPETVFNLASLLAATGRHEDAYLVAETCFEFDKDNAGVRDLVRQLEGMQRAGGPTAGPASTPAAGTLPAALQSAAVLYQSGRTNEAVAALDAMLTNNDPNSLLQLAEGFRELGRADRMEAALLRLSQVTPEHPETWLNLAMVQASLGKTSEAEANLEHSFKLSDARLAKNPKAEDIRADFKTNARFEQARPWFKLK